MFSYKVDNMFVNSQQIFLFLIDYASLLESGCHEFVGDQSQEVEGNLWSDQHW